MELFIFDLDDTLFKTTAKVIVRKENEIESYQMLNIVEINFT